MERRARLGRARPRIAALVALVATVMLLPAPQPAMAATPSSGIEFPDPETIAANNVYVTYGTNTGSGCPNSGDYILPYTVTGSGETIGLGDACPEGSAMNGWGSWAYQGPCAQMWAPSVVRYGGKYLVFYTASKAGTGAGCGSVGQMCIGVASSTLARGPFTNAREWACPASGRWAIDPDAFVGQDGNLYVTYRDDEAARVAGLTDDTALAVVRVDANGSADWSTHRVLLYSTDMTWESTYASTDGEAGNDHIIENPTMMYVAGRYHLFFSGNNWNRNRYSTGVADCGTSPLPAQRCDQNGVPGGSTSRPYWGYSGSGLNPVKTLPGNHYGPGGMSMFRTPGGQARVVWHWIASSNCSNGCTRRAIAGELSYTGSGGFEVD